MTAARGYQSAALAAFLWIVFGIESIVRPDQENYRDAVWYLPFIATSITFWFLHKMQAGRGLLIERIGYTAVMIACGLVMVGNIGVLFDIPALAVFAFPWGAVLWTLAMIPFGIGTAKAGVFPRYVGIALALLEPGSILTGFALSPIAPLHNRGGYSAGVEKGLVMALVSLGFLSLIRVRRAAS